MDIVSELENYEVPEWSIKYLKEAEGCFNNGLYVASVVMASVGFESVLRKDLKERGIKTKDNPTMGSICKKAHKVGLINDEENKLYWGCVDLRNASAHPKEVEVTKEKAQSIINLVKSYIKEKRPIKINFDLMIENILENMGINTGNSLKKYTEDIEDTGMSVGNKEKHVEYTFFRLKFKNESIDIFGKFLEDHGELVPLLTSKGQIPCMYILLEDEDGYVNIGIPLKELKEEIGEEGMILKLTKEEARKTCKGEVSRKIKDKFENKFNQWSLTP